MVAWTKTVLGAIVARQRVTVVLGLEHSEVSLDGEVGLSLLSSNGGSQEGAGKQKRVLDA